MRLYFTSILSLLALLVPITALAHSGHGALSGQELAHYLTSPAHVGPVLVLVACVAFFYLRNRKGSESRSR